MKNNSRSWFLLTALIIASSTAAYAEPFKGALLCTTTPEITLMDDQNDAPYGLYRKTMSLFLLPKEDQSGTWTAVLDFHNTQKEIHTVNCTLDFDPKASTFAGQCICPKEGFKIQFDKVLTLEDDKTLSVNATITAKLKKAEVSVRRRCVLESVKE